MTARSVLSRSRAAVAALLLFNVAPQVHGQVLQDFASAVELGVDGRQALYEVAVPNALYQGVVRADLGDVRVFNGASEVVPHAFRPRMTGQPAPIEHSTLTPFVLSAPAGVATEGFNARIERDGDRFRFEIADRPSAASERTVGYVLDTSGMAQPIRALRLDIGAMTGNVASSVRVEVSDDLQTWRPVVTGAPIVRLEAAGQQLRQDRIEFAPRRAKYWRISWGGDRRALTIASVEAEFASGPVEPAREWTEMAASPGKAGEYLFDAGGRFPVDRLQFKLPQANTVAVIEILTRNQASDPWRSTAAATIYRLTQDGTEVSSSPVSIPLTTDRHWLVRVDQRGGGIGQGSLSASIGWVPHRLVFVARGSPPFQLAFGSAQAAPSSYRVDTLIPGYRADQAIEPGKAQVQGHPSGQAIAIAAVQGPVRTVAGDAARAPSTPVKLWGLWTSIIAGVAVLAWMAWRLSRQLSSSASPTDARDTRPIESAETANPAAGAPTDRGSSSTQGAASPPTATPPTGASTK